MAKKQKGQFIDAGSIERPSSLHVSLVRHATNAA